jgi:predicted nucleic acid-binding Zn ribbon protein
MEAFQKITEDPLTTCESCGGSINRVLQPVGVVFKGTGFYVTDYKRKENGSHTGSDSGSTHSDTKETRPAAEKSDTPAKVEKKEAAPASA